MTNARPPRRGLFLLELTCGLTLVGVIAAVAVPLLAAPGRAVQAKACEHRRDAIDLQAALWKRNAGAWPAADLSDVAADPAYFPDGPPVCPVDGTPYVFSPATGRTVPHAHAGGEGRRVGRAGRRGKSPAARETRRPAASP